MYTMLIAAFRGGEQAVATWLDEGGCVDAMVDPFSEKQGVAVTFLMMAAAGGQEAMVRMLLQRGASVNLQNSLGFTALMHASLGGHTTIVQALLDAKADASLQSTNGGTALMWAELRQQDAVARLLRQHAELLTAEVEAGAGAPAAHAARAADATVASAVGAKGGALEVISTLALALTLTL